ncbi:hypothetical protein F511_15492 [Dorcoceras hygrometricum]|uniref:Uncharacterized protein n=1 Tax=Dorcoceras hygrometricum TaxID=472368 RepID=A0A2Z7BKJ1_9LAMI|nr:hypothetical protein F511_15492 [Dorcoceras hygrometricum]
MQHVIIDAMKCMRAIKDRISRPVYQLEISSVNLYTRTVYQPGKSSVCDLRSPSAQLDDVATVGTLRLVFTSSTTKPAATTSRNIIPKKYQNDIVATNQNDVTSLHQLMPNFLRNNQQLVTLSNPDASVAKQNDVAWPTSSYLSTDTSRLVPDANTVFPLNQTTSLLISDWFFNPTAGHSAGTILTTQQLIALQLHRGTTMRHSFATVPLNRVDV